MTMLSQRTLHLLMGNGAIGTAVTTFLKMTSEANVIAILIVCIKCALTYC